MQTYSPFTHSKATTIIILLVAVFSIAFVPLFLPPPGLDNPEAIGTYLNGQLPSLGPPEAVETTEAFPNITFNSPLTFTMHPQQNRVFVGQRDGKIYHFLNQSNVSSKALFLDLSAKVGVVWDGGFLGLTFHPNFGRAGQAGRNYFYVYYNTKDGNGGNEPLSPGPQPCIGGAVWNGGYNLLVRYEVNEGTNTVRANSETIMIRTRHYNTTHYGGGLLFGLDGFLYLTTGDQAQHNPAQILNNNLDGGVLRIDVDKDPSKSHAPIRKLPQDSRGPDEFSGREYWIPNDNPFLGNNQMEEYYSIGHRNPHRMTMDTQTGKLYIGEIGSSIHEEINIVKKGANFGWPIYEGFNRNNTCLSSLYQNMPHEGPLTAFPRSEANAIIGGYVYRGSAIPCLYGKYVCADYGNGEELYSVDINTGDYTRLGAFIPGNVISFGEDHDGELYALGQGNNVKIHKFRLAGTTPAPPARLSQTGAFTNLANLTPRSGIIPYDLIEPFWSDGALKQRWMAIPNNGSHNTAAEKIKFSEEGEWEFPIGSVLIKHFELPINENNPSQTRRLETRFSVKGQDGNFYFLTYKWRADGSDADLIQTSVDENYTVQVAGGGTRQQAWHFPNQGECMTCHNEATKGTLGPRTRQLNKNFLYEKTGIIANQLVTLSSLGILDQNISDANTANFLTSVAKDDMNAGLEQRARSYLDVNCGYCHRPGTGNRAVFDARLSTSLSASNLFSGSINEQVGPLNSKIITPRNTNLSELYLRLHSLEVGIAMPPISKNKRDDEGVQLIADWINNMGTQTGGGTCLPTGKITQELWTNLSNSTNISSIPLTSAPNISNEISQFEISTNSRDNYGVRLRGYIYPPQTGNYQFWIASDDQGQFWISNSTNASGKQLVASLPTYTGSRQWTKFASQQSAPVYLEQGKAYYVEALMREGQGGDNLAVGWTLPNGSLQRPLPGNRLSPMSVTPCSGGGCIDVDGDGVCATEDCNDNNAAISRPGDSCNDQNANTSNDRIQNNCICAGTLTPDSCTDADNDGICQADDCNDNNANIGAQKTPGTTCNDGNANTSNDQIQGDGCTCAGNPSGGGGGSQSFSCEAVTVTYGNGSIQMTGPAGSSYYFKVNDLDNGWIEVLNCTSNCGNSQSISNLTNENYLIRIYNTSWSELCSEQIVLSGDNSGGGDSGGCTDADNDGVCQADDCNDNNANIGARQTPGTSCNDGNSNTSNDQIQADGCTCAGSPSDNGGGSSGGGGSGSQSFSCGEVSVTYGNGSIQMNGIAGSSYFFKVTDLDNGWVDILDCVTTCGSSQSVNNLAGENYLIRIFTTSWAALCSETIQVTRDGGGSSGGGGCTDADNDGVCQADDCNDNNANIGAQKTPGTACNDGNSNTSNDQIQANGCTCAGTPSSSGGGNQTETCGDITITYGGGNLQMTGQAGQNYFFKVARTSPGWASVLDCVDNSCGRSQSLSGLQNGTYTILLFTNRWQRVCEDVVITMTGSAFTSNDRSKPSTATIAEQKAFYKVPTPINIYPNPAKYLLTFDLSDYTSEAMDIQIIGIDGVLLKELHLKEDHASRHQMDVSDLANGIYQVQISRKNTTEQVSKRVVIAR